MLALLLSVALLFFSLCFAVGSIFSLSYLFFLFFLLFSFLK